MITVHVPAPPKFSGLFQDCGRCGYVLQDYTGGEVMTLAEDAGQGIPYWTEGGRVAVRGGATWRLDQDAPLDPGMTECRPTS